VWSIVRALAIRLFDVRRGEGAPIAGAFATLFAIMMGHTILEAARDALLLQRLPPRALGIVYVVIAALTLPAGALLSRVSRRFGPPRALGSALLVASAAVVGLFLLPRTAAAAVATYAVSGLVGAVVVPEFWVVVASHLTVAQGRRLMGAIGAAAILGAIFGSVVASSLLMFVEVAWLLPVAASVFTVAGIAVLAALHYVDTPPEPALPERPPLSILRAEPFLGRIALLVVLSTSTVLAADYLFKFTVARAIPPEGLGPFFARYYGLLNAVSFAVQIFATRALVERLGVATAIVITPLLLAMSGAFAVATAGALTAVLVVKGLDGSLRYSLQRITSELLYLPVSEATRIRGKPLIDGAVARATQAVAALLFLALAEARLLSVPVLAASFAALACGWLLVALVTRRPYLALLRRAIASGQTGGKAGADPLDFASAEFLVERLASPNPLEIIAAMRVLERRGHSRLVPALMLFHPDARVIVHALDTFSTTERADWWALGEPMLHHQNEAVRRAAIRAFARQGRADLLESMAGDENPRVRAYVAVHLALRDGADLLAEPRVVEHLSPPNPADLRGRLGLLAAVGTAPRSPSAADLLVRLAADPALTSGAEAPERLAVAAARQQDPRLIPDLVRLLGAGPGRAALRETLVSLGELAEVAVWEALTNPASPRRLRVHLPRSLSRFGTKRAADHLLECIETEGDGLVRYKAIRGLGRLVADRGMRLNRRRVVRLVRRNLLEYLRLFGLRVGIDLPWTKDPEDPRRARVTSRLLSGLLEDKLSQSLERAFRLFQIAYLREDIRRVHFAVLSKDARLRANAGEFIEEVLFRRDREPMLALFRLVTDDIDAEDRVRRSALLLPEAAPRSHEGTVVALMEDPDATVASLARVHALALGGEILGGAVFSSGAARPSLIAETARFYSGPPPG
jgi:AAA family ATP:ADP antiporter